MTTTHGTLRRVLVTVVTAALVCAIGGCSSKSEDGPDTQSKSGTFANKDVNEITSLPELTRTQQAREMVSQTEDQINGRLTLLSALADECATCSLALDSALVASSERLQLAGGLWDPWGGFQQRPWSSNQVQLLNPIPEPGFTVESVAGYMGETAKSQLQAMAEAESVPASQRLTFSSLLIERMISASLLAEEFGFQLGEATARLTDEGTPSFVIDGAPSPAPSEESPQSEGQLSLEQQSLVQFDCVYGELIRNISVNEDEAQTENAIRFAQGIQDRTVSLSALGISDHRLTRCSLASTDPSDLLAELVRIDAGLLGSDNGEIRRLASQWVFADVESLVTDYPERAQSLTLVNSISAVDAE
ncbi:hypothetical protein U6G28_07730 [Actinomycetaceae bacterium MB13-C1-2]|nr:hypothetical protein U6G28_07730 [Actinomycetaceae bacterium MB13-C1-2]